MWGCGQLIEDNFFISLLFYSVEHNMGSKLECRSASVYLSFQPDEQSSRNPYDKKTTDLFGDVK